MNHQFNIERRKERNKTEKSEKTARNRQSFFAPQTERKGRTIFDLILRYTLHLVNYSIETCCKMCHGHPVAHPLPNTFTNDCVSRYGNADSHTRIYIYMHARRRWHLHIKMRGQRSYSSLSESIDRLTRDYQRGDSARKIKERFIYTYI